MDSRTIVILGGSFRPDIFEFDTETKMIAKVGDTADFGFNAWANQSALISSDHVVALVDGLDKCNPLTLVSWRRARPSYTKLKVFPNDAPCCKDRVNETPKMEGSRI